MPEKPKSESQPKTQTVGYRVKLIAASDVPTVEALLNELGAQGWELVALRQLSFAHDMYIFKRAPAS